MNPGNHTRGIPVREDVYRVISEHRGITVAEICDLLPQYERQDVRKTIWRLNGRCIRKSGSRRVRYPSGASVLTYCWEALRWPT